MERLPQSVDKFDIFPNKSRNGATRNDGIARLNPSLRCAPFRLLFELVDGLRQTLHERKSELIATHRQVILYGYEKTFCGF